MRTIGLIGGMSYTSTAVYYERLNSEAQRRLGGLRSAEVLLRSVDFGPIAAMQADGRWDEAGTRLADIAHRLEIAGADLIVLATNTMHKVADRIEASVSVPFIHIADATANAIKRCGHVRPGIMATAFTMEQDFYVGRLRRYHGLDVVIPEEADRRAIHRIIYEELVRNVRTEASRQAYIDIAQRLVARGADCLILGCTEIGLLIDATCAPVPVFDTTTIHADAALDFALAPATAH